METPRSDKVGRHVWLPSYPQSPVCYSLCGVKAGAGTWLGMLPHSLPTESVPLEFEVTLLKDGQEIRHTLRGGVGSAYI